MRVAMPINWNLTASSLTNITRHNFRELGKLMNETKSFTLSAIGIQSLGLGDFNQRYDLVHIPNMGGYRFPTNATQHCNNIIFGLSGIDEVIYGKEVMLWKHTWYIEEPIIKKEIENWKKYVHKVKSIHVTAKSEFEEMHKYLGIPYEKMKIIPHGVDHDFFVPSKNKEKTRTNILLKLKIPDQRYFLHIGEINFVRKNLERLVESFGKCRQSGLKHNLLIAGKNTLELKNICSDKPGIFLLGWVPNDDLLELIQGADAFLLPSIHEGFGMPLVEAMSCGIPCISSNCHAPPEVISDSGILINPYDVSEITNAMLSLANNPKLLEELSEKSLKRSNDFSWKKNAQQIFELYKIDPNQPMNNFEYFYDLAAYRTLVSVCDFFPDEKQNMILSLLRFDYNDLINWAINYGLDNPMSKDFLLPFEEWLVNHSSRN
jgi:glycosyltransferase involved in cell wall biosynthesis